MSEMNDAVDARICKLEDESSDWSQVFRTNAPKEVILCAIQTSKDLGNNYDNEMIYDVIRALGYPVEVLEDNDTETYSY
jgi:hypothetical protein